MYCGILLRGMCRKLRHIKDSITTFVCIHFYRIPYCYVVFQLNDIHVSTEYVNIWQRYIGTQEVCLKWNVQSQKDWWR